MCVKEEIIGVSFSSGRTQALGLIPDAEKKSCKKYSPGLAFACHPSTERWRQEDEEIMFMLGHSEFELNLLKKKNGHTRKDELNGLVALRSESANCGGLSLQPQVLRRQELRSSRPSLGNKSQLELEYEE